VKVSEGTRTPDRLDHNRTNLVPAGLRGPYSLGFLALGSAQFRSFCSPFCSPSICSVALGHSLQKCRSAQSHLQLRSAVADAVDVRALRYPLLFLIASPAVGSLVPSLIWLAWIGNNGKALLVLVMGSLVATARIAMRLLDRLGATGMWVRLASTISAAIVGIAIWATIRHAGGIATE
jgi:hypothetical protein